jgi:hypothetical protein
MIRIARQRFVARIVVAALLFAQALVAYADCQMPARSPAAAIAADDHPCHQTRSETNLCLAHCLAADQSLDKPQTSMPQPATASVLVLQPVSDTQYVHAAALRRFGPPTAAPPPRILFRTLRI